MTRFIAIMLLVAACSGGAPADAPVGALDDDHVDAQPIDAPGVVDAPQSIADAPPMSMIDATSNGCGKTGMMCASAAECGAGFQCYIGGGGGVCAKDRPTCGGFAGAMCAMDAPQCHYLTGADFGPCLTVAEETCVCALDHGAVQSCP